MISKALRAARAERRLLLLLAICLIRFSSRFRRAIVLGILKSDVGCQVVLKISRLLLGKLLPPILVNWWYYWPGHITHDGCQVLHNVDYIRGVRYGRHKREVLDILYPLEGESKQDHNAIDPSGVVHLGIQCVKELTVFAFRGSPALKHDTLIRKANSPAILFAHGGGWVCEGTDVQVQQLTPLVRSGFSVFTFNYPLAPESRFPVAVVSTLRVLAWLKREKGIDSVACIGESAGGNLITMATAFLHNPQLLKELNAIVEENILDWDYPKITCVVSWYSILCSEHWKGAEWLSPGLERVFDFYKSGLFGNRVTLLDLEDDLDKFPPTLLVSGRTDPLGLLESSKACHRMFVKKDIPSKLCIYNSTHGFVSFPVQIQKAVSGSDAVQEATQAMEDTLEFLLEHHASF
mmetsp:Transcript_6942/g.10988  ORF Transcript_6942/g.10988 Transcript_6942/m.10988 type:complete len:406 (+) Transcript_6942:20-1237(+)